MEPATSSQPSIMGAMGTSGAVSIQQQTAMTLSAAANYGTVSQVIYYPPRDLYYLMTLLMM